MKFVHVFIILTLFYRGIFAQDMNLSDNKTIHHRIIGGRTAKIENFPFTACLILKDPDGDDFRGGAAIIGDHWVLTASHCMTYISLESINLGLAFVRSNTRTWNANYSDHMILKTHQHEEYDSNLTDYDIAVIKVKEPFTASHEKPAKLPGAFYKYEDNSIATVLGWGTTDPKAVEPFVVTNLRMVNIKLMNFNTCKELYKQANELVTERMMCGSAAGKDACVFDSGGPLYQNGFLIGVVSWGSPKCADLVLPGVYTKVSIFHHWILRKISENNTVLPPLFRNLFLDPDKFVNPYETNVEYEDLGNGSLII